MSSRIFKTLGVFEKHTIDIFLHKKVWFWPKITEGRIVTVSKTT